MKLQYVLITPARNEEDNIENTIKSVISQTYLPRKWVIVNDGSSDNTKKIIKQYLSSYNWIELVNLQEHRDRTFAAKVNCFNAGYEKIKDIEYDIIGNLDADITFGKDYFAFIIDKFANISDLGVAGTPFVEGSKHYNYKFTNIEHVSGACQLFRKECFEEIGGYMPIKSGGIDWVAVTTARMKGWKTRTFTEKTCFHHRKMGSGNYNNIHIRIAQGRKDYYLGGHPLWQIFRTFYQMTQPPYIIGGMMICYGYFWALLNRVERPISNELMIFVRHEQMMRLKRKLASPLKFIFN